MPKFYIDAQKRPFALRKGLFAAGLNLNARLFGFLFLLFQGAGGYCAGEQIGFARCATDYAVTFMLMDVIIDERFRGRGLGKALVSAILSHEKLQGLSCTLATRDAHGLYARFGFSPVDPNYYMKKPAQK